MQRACGGFTSLIFTASCLENYQNKDFIFFGLRGNHFWNEFFKLLGFGTMVHEKSRTPIM